jgi:hypothetical protein
MMNMMNLPLSTRYTDRDVILASELVQALQELIAAQGDRPVSIGITSDYAEVLRFGDVDVLDA